MLVYGTEAVLPIKIPEPSLRMRQFEQDENKSRMRTTLDLFPETRTTAYLRSELCILKMKRYFNRTVKVRPLEVGDLVLRKMEIVGKAGAEGKLTLNWEGSYVIREKVKIGTYRLSTTDGKEIPRTWNVCNLKKYFV